MNAAILNSYPFLNDSDVEEVNNEDNLLYQNNDLNDFVFNTKDTLISSYLCGFTEDDSKEDIVKKSSIPPTEIRYITKSILISICIAMPQQD